MGVFGLGWGHKFNEIHHWTLFRNTQSCHTWVINMLPKFSPDLPTPQLDLSSPTFHIIPTLFLLPSHGGSKVQSHQSLFTEQVKAAHELTHSGIFCRIHTAVLAVLTANHGSRSTKNPRTERNVEEYCTAKSRKIRLKCRPKWNCSLSLNAVPVEILRFIKDCIWHIQMESSQLPAVIQNG